MATTSEAIKTALIAVNNDKRLGETAVLLEDLLVMAYQAARESERNAKEEN